MDRPAVEAEVICRLKSRNSGIVVYLAGQDKPGNRYAEALPGTGDFLGEDLKEGLFCDWCNGIGALRAVVAEACGPGRRLR